MFKSGYRIAACLAASLIIAAGCSAGADPSQEQLDPTSPAPAAAPAAPETSDGIAAGEAGQGVGLERWEFGDEGIYGLDRNGEVLAEFHINRDNFSIESVLPEAGVYGRDGSSQLSAVTQPFYDALQRDLVAAFGDSAPTRDAAAVLPSTLVDCYLILANCGADALVLRLAGLTCTCAPDSQCPFILPIGLNCT